MINHIHHDIDKLVRVDESGGRVYQTPTGEKYPSVTAVTGILSMASIQEWRKRVGEAEADRISKRASQRGTEVHSLCEAFLKNEQPNPSPFDFEMFNSILPELKKINNVRCLETPLFSHHLRVAGTVDCIADYDGKRSVIDFKTASKIKTKESIDHYFMQTAAYAVMFEERTGIPVNQLVIIMGCDESTRALVFIEKRDNWIQKFIDLRHDYYKLKGR
jgi:ATP-dependent exoDNAse (exonuclease V) beta subunit